jgi:hypothetical protein
MEFLYYKQILDNIGEGSAYAILLDHSEFLCSFFDYVQCRAYGCLLFVVSDLVDRIE